MEEGLYKAVFIDTEEYLGLKIGHQYEIEIIQEKRNYLIVVHHDITEDLPTDIYVPMSSSISINNTWQITEREQI